MPAPTARNVVPSGWNEPASIAAKVGCPLFGMRVEVASSHAEGLGWAGLCPPSFDGLVLMRKTLTIAFREYRAMVATKAFVISLVMMPLMMFGGIVAMEAMEKLARSETLKIAISDPDNRYFDALNTAAESRNRTLQSNAGQPQIEDLEKLADSNDLEGDKGPIPDVDVFQLERIGEPLDDELRLKLSNQIRAKELYAFVEIPSGLLDENNPADTDPAAGDARQAVLFYAESTGINPVRRWLGRTVNEVIKQQRLQALGIDPAAVAHASRSVAVTSLKPVSVDNAGKVSTEETKDPVTSMILPLAMMMMMFGVIVLAAQPMLESVLEEKSQRIAEVLLGSCNPTQLMAGKLLGTVAGSLTVFGFYAVGGYLFAAQQNYLDYLPLDILPWFIVYQLGAVLFYSSIFLAIGSSVSQLKEAQSLMMPVWLMLVLPLMTWFVIVQKPDGGLALGLSLFPPTAPTIMVLRLSTGSTVPMWQLLLSLLLLASAIILCVYLAGRIFRIGILWQGKAPQLSQILKWGWKS